MVPRGYPVLLSAVGRLLELALDGVPRYVQSVFTHFAVECRSGHTLDGVRSGDVSFFLLCGDGFRGLDHLEVRKLQTKSTLYFSTPHRAQPYTQPYSIYKYTANIPRTARAAAFLEAPFL